MSAPSSQVISFWVIDSLASTEWIRLDEACKRVISIRMKSATETYISDLVESNVAYVAEHLRDEVAGGKIDGVSMDFEIDEEEMPYIRLSDVLIKPLLGKLRKINPFDFERVCARILAQLGAQADVTKRTNDDGVDFFAIDFDFVPDGINTPQACRAAVIGQAKRYKEGNLVRETDVRSFVGGAVKVKDDLALERKILPLSPVVFAFWTTSDFDPNAKQYARRLGIWYLSGRALAKYIIALKLELFVEECLADTARTNFRADDQMLGVKTGA
ncbi:restriction endonuclease [Xanthomonas arboricola]|uniref:restriction endonuclease n=1 Tax=Xanthomonas arboricola TaxID=56448 RepID=UPI003EBBE51C